MTQKTLRRPRREDALSRERIIDAAIELLDSGGEAALTFRTLSAHLATGPGAIYGHVANKHDLLVAACDAVVSRTVEPGMAGASPQATVRALALALFDAMDAHPWIGSALSWTAGQLTMVRIIECIGQQLHALGVAPEKHWASVSALLTVPAGTRAGRKLRLRGRGLAQGKAGHGDLYALVHIDVAATPSEQERALYLELSRVSHFNPRPPAPHTAKETP